jgi:predicted phosphodiesterase
MKREEFIKKTILGAGGLAAFPLFQGCSSEENPENKPTPPQKPVETSGEVRLGVVTDVHMHYFPYAETRLQEFINAAEKNKVDLIISIGDFTYPAAKNKSFVDIWNSFSGPKYQTIGNHDCDATSKKLWLDFVGQTKLGNYYSFDQNGFHFVVLDDNFIKTGNSYIPYDRKNYTKYSNKQIAFVPPDELNWLRNDLKETNKPTIVFNHQPPDHTMGNGGELMQVFNNENKKGKKVIAVFSGHDHKNWAVNSNGIHYIQINSSSYHFVGKSKPPVKNRKGYGKKVEENYPISWRIAPYDRSLYAIVDINGPDRTLNITGRKGKWVPPSPYELGYVSNPANQFHPSPSIDSRNLKF